jgi:hypothetical protein
MRFRTKVANSNVRSEFLAADADSHCRAIGPLIAFRRALFNFGEIDMVRGYFYFGLDDVLNPVALACGDISGIDKSRERRHRDVVCSTNTGFEHASAPYRDAIFEAVSLDAASNGVTTYTAEFDVDNPAGAKSNRRLCVPQTVYALFNCGCRREC